MSDDDFEVVFGSGNVFRDFSYADADIRQAKCILAAEIIKILNAREWSTRRAEEATGVNHADFSRIRNANIGRFTLDRLMAILGKLGQEVELAVSVKPRQQQRSAADARLGQGSEQVETAIVWSVIAIVVIAVVVTSRFWWPKRWTEEWEEQQAARERYRLANGWVGKCYHEIMRDGGERSCPYCGKQFPEREPRHPPLRNTPEQNAFWLAIVVAFVLIALLRW